MPPNAAGVAWSLCLCVCLSVGNEREPYIKSDDPIEIPFGVLTRLSPGNQVLGGNQIPRGQVKFRGKLFGPIAKYRDYAT